MPPIDAVIVAVAAAETGVVLTVKVAEVAPAATVTEAGSVALPEFEARLTITPPVGAAPLSDTEPEEVLPPTTVDGDTATEETVGGLIVRDEVIDAREIVAVMAAVVTAATGLVVTVNVVDVDPAGMVTDVGTTALALLEASVTTVPPVGAVRLTVIVAVDEVPPVTLPGENVRAVGTVVLSTFDTKPEKIMGPQPVAVSHPTVATDVFPLGSVPLFPVVMS